MNSQKALLSKLYIPSSCEPVVDSNGGTGITTVKEKRNISYARDTWREIIIPFDV